MAIIKWPGGKTSEFKYIADMIPEFDRYVEPFFGGGAIFFALEPKKALINDISLDLMNFYKLIIDQNKLFLKIVHSYDTFWSNTLSYLDNKSDELINMFHNNKFFTDETGIILDIIDLLKQESIEHQDYNMLSIQLVKNANNKIKRIASNQLKKGIMLSEEDLLENIITGLISGIYMYYRFLHNNFLLNEFDPQKKELQASIFYLIREYCYGSMFRYNKKGEFNIPYGGMSYNRKNVLGKIDKFFGNDRIQILDNVIAENLDFELFLNKHNLKESDFIFLDPPYDTEFNDYEGVEFTKEDQARLAKYLINTRAKFILIIKETSFIRNLYCHEQNIYVDDFEKKYTYNVRGRNDRDVRHLLIYNFKKT